MGAVKDTLLLGIVSQFTIHVCEKTISDANTRKSINQILTIINFTLQ
jgi:hypothetical protein